MNPTALPAFSDNYIWMFHDGREAVVVDPGDAAPVLAALEQHQVALAAILVTHHHSDHVGGIDALRGRLRGADGRPGTVYGPARERIPAPYVPLDGGATVDVLGLRFGVIDVPGHTAGHIAYFHAGSPASGGVPWLFCGDTLFSAGCGRLFEGTPAQMNGSLAALSALPGDSLVCCAHEYTLSNLRFARAVEPDNPELADYTRWCEAQRAEHRPTLPATLARERLVNPFLRCAEPAVVQAAQRHGAHGSDGVEVFAALRQWKNDFR